MRNLIVMICFVLTGITACDLEHTHPLEEHTHPLEEHTHLLKNPIATAGYNDDQLQAFSDLFDTLIETASDIGIGNRDRLYLEFTKPYRRRLIIRATVERRDEEVYVRDGIKENRVRRRRIWLETNDPRVVFVLWVCDSSLPAPKDLYFIGETYVFAVEIRGLTSGWKGRDEAWQISADNLDICGIPDVR